MGPETAAWTPVYRWHVWFLAELWVPPCRSRRSNFGIVILSSVPSSCTFAPSHEIWSTLMVQRMKAVWINQ